MTMIADFGPRSPDTASIDHHSIESLTSAHVAGLIHSSIGVFIIEVDGPDTVCILK